MALYYGKSFLGYFLILMLELFVLSLFISCDNKANALISKDKESPISSNYLESRRMKRRIDVEPYDTGANETSRYIELMLVIDKNIFRELGKSITKVHKRYSRVVQHVNLLYQRFNMFVALVDIKIWTDDNKIKIIRNFEKTLDNFQKYAKKLLKNKNVDAVHLITSGPFSGQSSDSVSVFGGMCGNDFQSVGVNFDRVSYSDEIYVIANLIAYEIAHTMGINDDEDYCNCFLEECVMSPGEISEENPEWSSCSVEAMEKKLQSDDLTCLNNKPTRVFQNPTCGNGVVEPGEECDCGKRGWGDKCKNPECCNQEICMLRAPATCAFGECCDVKKCQVRQAGTVCRAKLHDCDLPEYCDGAWEHCPDDVVKSGGERCFDGPECFNHKCNGTEAICFFDCNNHGVCNSKGHCHCEDNYEPPLCYFYGAGGSIDSGPAQDPKYAPVKQLVIACLELIVVAAAIYVFYLLYAYCFKKACFNKQPGRVIQSVSRNEQENRSNVYTIRHYTA